MTVLAGVDVGGSHIEAAVAERPGSVVIRARGAPTPLSVEQVSKTAQVIERTVTAALSQSGLPSPEVLVIGAAGAGDPTLRDNLHMEITSAKLARRIHIVTDVELQLEAAFSSESGVLLAAGTGSIAIAQDARGHKHRVGGHGFRFGDDGSGYAIGADAIRAVLMATERRGPSTILVELLFLETETRDAEKFALWTRRASRDEVAALAPVVMLAHQAGDPVAKRILTSAAKDLVAHVRALAPVVGGGTRIPVAFAGGLLEHDTPLRREITSQLERALPTADLLPNPIDPIDGALRIAQRLSGGR